MKLTNSWLCLLWACTIKHFTVVISTVILEASLFITASLFQPSLIFEAEVPKGTPLG
jgi:hypothetical protein